MPGVLALVRHPLLGFGGTDPCVPLHIVKGAFRIRSGFSSPDVVLVDLAMGAGTFLLSALGPGGCLSRGRRERSRIVNAAEHAWFEQCLARCPAAGWPAWCTNASSNSADANTQPLADEFCARPADRHSRISL
jgi:hypothetical protein